MNELELELISHRNSFYNMPLSLAVDKYNCLSDDDKGKRVIALRFGLSGKKAMTVSEVASELGLTTMGVKSLELLALRDMLRH